MEVKNPSKKLLKHNDKLKSLVDKLRKSIFDVINEQSSRSMATLSETLDELREFRQFVNNTENIGFLVGIIGFQFGSFPLTGDPEKDLGQISNNLPKSKMN